MFKKLLNDYRNSVITSKAEAIKVISDFRKKVKYDTTANKLSKNLALINDVLTELDDKCKKIDIDYFASMKKEIADKIKAYEEEQAKKKRAKEKRELAKMIKKRAEEEREEENKKWREREINLDIDKIEIMKKAIKGDYKYIKLVMWTSSNDDKKKYRRLYIKLKDHTKIRETSHYIIFNKISGKFELLEYKFEVELEDNMWDKCTCCSDNIENYSKHVNDEIRKLIDGMSIQVI